jgi:hypothetical protein
MVFHLLFSWSSFLSWVFFLGDLVLMGFLAFKAYQDAEILERYKTYTLDPYFFLDHNISKILVQKLTDFSSLRIGSKFPFSEV